MRPDREPGIAALSDLLAQRAAERGADPAFIFLDERGEPEAALDFAALDRRARALAAHLLTQAAPGDRALLVFLPGLDFIVAFFACLAAGLIAAPLMPPRRTGRDSSAAVVADCRPAFVLTSSALAAARPDIADRFGALPLIAVDAASELPLPASALPRPGRSDIAFLQYTSGSTATPKGVMVSHGNLLANMEMIRRGMTLTERSTSVGWVPVYHDMGLMMGVILPVYLGALSVQMAPAAFMRRPLHWLRAISRFGAEVTSAPNFAYDLCVDRFRPELMEGVDLSRWRVAMNAAEPVQADTIARFAETFAPFGFAPGAIHPAYGLAEATLLVTSDAPGVVPLTRGAGRAASVSCGRSLPGQRALVVDPESRRPLDPGQIGEIWASGANIAHGYWNNPQASAEVFEARLARDESGPRWLRTGDLGFLDDNGALFVTGRIKDLIIIRGVNHYPQEIERTVQAAHPALRRDWGAAFAAPDERGQERLVIVQEVERAQRHHLDGDAMVASIREAVAAEHDLAAHDIVLIRPASLPKTTSGKVQRRLTRQLWQQGGLDRL